MRVVPPLSWTRGLVSGRGPGEKVVSCRRDLKSETARQRALSVDNVVGEREQRVRRNEEEIEMVR